MEVNTRTCYNSLLQTCALLGLPYVIMTNTTLNERFGIQANVKPAADVYPKLRYFAVGNGGHSTSIGVDNVSAPSPKQHVATDASVFKPLPFVMRETTNDLSPGQREKYALRREEEHRGKRYYVYYLKRIDVAAVIPTLEYISVRDGVTTTQDFVPDNSNLNPIPVELSTTGANTTTGEYISASAKLPLTLSEFDMTELRNVSMVLFNDEKYGVVSELALCTGVDKNVQVSGVGNTVFSFNEAIAVQVASYVSTFLPSKYLPSGAGVLLDLGATEPLFRLATPGSVQTGPN